MQHNFVELAQVHLLDSGSWSSGPGSYCPFVPVAQEPRLGFLACFSAAAAEVEAFKLECWLWGSRFQAKVEGH